METWVEVQQTAHVVPISGSYVNDAVGLISGTEDPYVGTDQPVNYGNAVDGKIYTYDGKSANYGKTAATFYTKETHTFHSIGNEYSTVDNTYDGVAVYITGQIVGTQDSDTQPNNGPPSHVTIPSGTDTEVRGGTAQTTTTPSRSFDYASTIWYDGGPASADPTLPAATEQWVQNIKDVGVGQSSQPLVSTKTFMRNHEDETNAAFESLGQSPDIQDVAEEATHSSQPIKYMRNQVAIAAGLAGAGGTTLAYSTALIGAGVFSAGVPPVLGTALLLGAAIKTYDVLTGGDHFSIFEDNLPQSITSLPNAGQN